VCNVISGFGGSVHYGDAVKLSRFPAGRRLADLLGAERIDDLVVRAEEILLPVDTPFESLRAVAGRFEEYRLKDYPVATLDSAQVRVLVDRLYQRVSRHPRIETALRQQARRVEPGPCGFTVDITDPRSGVRLRQVHAKRVVLAVGRRGQGWWSGELRRLGLAHREPTPSVGVRFETPVELLAPAGRMHPDFKASRVVEGVKTKSFCLCAGEGGGRIKFTDYGSHTLLDGHVVPEPGGRVANLALLAQLRDDRGRPRDREWIEEHLLAPYRALRPNRPGKPVLQHYPDFKAGLLRLTTWREVVDTVGFTPSLADYGVANLAAILPEPTRHALCTAFEDLLRRFTPDPSSSEPERLARVAVAGLELEGLWDEMDLTSSMETSLPDLFACGDASGLAQGILQAAVGGVAVGLRIADQHRTGAPAAAGCAR
jgi:uncharacterized FAD-dependent dehydrogenase